MQALLWTVALGSLPVAAAAAWADRRRAGREGMDRVGWVPWSGITVAALFSGVGALLLALHG